MQKPYTNNQTLPHRKTPEKIQYPERYKNATGKGL